MENKIKINDEWYIKEKSIKSFFDDDVIKVNKFNKNNITYFQGYVYEDNLCMFEATTIQNYEDISIKFIDKSNKETKDWKEEYWDNKNWMLGIYNGYSESLEEAREIMDKDTIDKFIQFIGFLIEKKWIKNE